MNKNVKLLLWVSLVSWLSFVLFWSNIKLANAAATVGYGYSCSNIYGYGNTCSGTPNWGTYTQKDLYNTTGTIIWNANQTLIMTNYGLVSKTVTASGTVIKLLDIATYVDRSKPAQNEFGNPRQLKAKKTEAMPNVWSDMTNAYVLALESSELVK